MQVEPSDSYEFTKGKGDVLLIACGALAREIVDLIEANRWTAFDVTCLPAKWHNTPDKITPGVRDKIRANKDKYRKIYVLYGDCGTGGQLDTMLEEEGAERIEGPHCYSFFSGNTIFEERADEDMTAFFLTDYLARHFDKLIWQGLGMDRHPDLRDMYFANYTKVIYFAQVEDENLKALAEAAAERLGLDYEYRFSGFGDLETFMRQSATSTPR